MDQVEFILRLSENAQEVGDDIARRHNEERAAHVRHLLDLERMADLALQNVRAELSRFGLQQVPSKAKQLPETGHPRHSPPAPAFLNKGGNSSNAIPKESQ